MELHGKSSHLPHPQPKLGSEVGNPVSWNGAPSLERKPACLFFSLREQ